MVDNLNNILECQKYAFVWISEPKLENGKKYYQGFERKGDTFRVGDNVEVFENKGSGPSVGHLTLLWEDENEVMWCRVRWFLRHDETLCNCGGSIHKDENDLFLTDFCEDFHCLCIKGKCEVFHKSMLLEQLLPLNNKIPRGILKEHQYCCKQQIGDQHKNFAPVRYENSIFDDHNNVKYNLPSNGSLDGQLFVKKRKNGSLFMTACHICKKDSAGGTVFETCQHSFCRGCMWKRFRVKAGSALIKKCPCCNPCSKRRCPCGKMKNANKKHAAAKKEPLYAHNRKNITSVPKLQNKTSSYTTGKCEADEKSRKEKVSRSHNQKESSSSQNSNLETGTTLYRMSKALELLESHADTTKTQKQKIKRLQQSLKESRATPSQAFDMVDVVLRDRCFGDNVLQSSETFLDTTKHIEFYRRIAQCMISILGR